jgi:hypothetical protein
MSRHLLVAMLGIAWLLSAGPTIAQRDPQTRRELAQVIREAGYECGEVESIDLPANPPPGFESFTPDIVLCTNGKRFLVARTGRGGNTEKPLVRPLF